MKFGLSFQFIYDADKNQIWVKLSQMVEED